jgi:hypothetical protein
MPLISEATKTLETRLPKVISPTAHGVIDYAHAAFFFTVGALCSRSNQPATKRAAWAAFATGGFLLVESLLTDYRLGVKPVIPFERHGEMDSMFAASSWVLPRLLGFTGTGPARIFELNSLAEGSVVGMTDWDSQRAHRERVRS